jgi:alpha-D-xyloside xylohydrolase
MPYFFRCALEASNDGLPLMRPMVLEFTDDPSCAYADRQYMIGSNLLAAPVFCETGTVSYYLPKGKWTNIISGTVAEGNCWQTETHNYFSLPLMARPNSIIAMGSNKCRPDYDYTDNIVFHLFELDDGKAAFFDACDNHGNLAAKVEASRQKSIITITGHGMKKPWAICIRNIHNYCSAEGITPTDSKEGLLFSMKAEDKQITLELQQ